MSEADRACFLAFFFLKTELREDFTPKDVAGWLEGLGFAVPNTSRLGANLRASRDTLKGRTDGSFRLRHTCVERLATKFPNIGERPQEVVDDGTILPHVLYKNTGRGFIEKLAAQINVTYEQNAFDACAVMMRRLTEVLLIISYEHLGITAEIKDPSDNYLLLEGICTNAKANTKLGLSRNGKTSIETFRQLGNFSAHKITYTCKREYIQQEIMAFRALVDELLHKSGLLK